MFKTSLRSVVIAATLAAASVAAHADIAINAYLDFDSVASGTTANAYTAGLGLSAITFGNANRVDDDPIYDSVGNLLNDGAFHWVDDSANLGPVKIISSAYAVSGSNVLSNDYEPILVQFAGPVNLSSFSVKLDTQTYGFFGYTLSFLDSTGHVISGADVSYDTLGQSNVTVAAAGPVQNVSSILLNFGSRNFDNMSIVTAAAAVPEPSTWLMLGAGLGLLGFIGRRRSGSGSGSGSV